MEEKMIRLEPRLTSPRYVFFNRQKMAEGITIPFEILAARKQNKKQLFKGF